MANEIIKHQPQNSLVKKADNYLAHLNALMPKKYAPDLPELIPYRKGDLWGFCDRDKNIVIECKYDKVHPFCEGLAKIEVNYKGFGFIDKLGVEVIPLTRFEPHDFFSEEFVVIGKNANYGYMDKSGNQVVPFKYESAYDFKDGLAIVNKSKSMWYGEWGFIDKNFNEVIACKYHHIWNFTDGLAKVLLNDKYGYIDKDGIEVIKLQYDNTSGFYDEFAEVTLNDKSWFINKNNVEVDESIVNLKMKWKVIDEEGVEIILLNYEKVDLLCEGLAVVNKPRVGNFKRYGYIDKNGVEVIPCTYHTAHKFEKNGLAGVERFRLKGYINKLGIEVIPLKYSSAWGFGKDGLSYVNAYQGNDRNAKENKWAYIDMLGNEYWENDAEEVESANGMVTI